MAERFEPRAESFNNYKMSWTRWSGKELETTRGARDGQDVRQKMLNDAGVTISVPTMKQIAKMAYPKDAKACLTVLKRKRKLLRLSRMSEGVITDGGKRKRKRRDEKRSVAMRYVSDAISKAVIFYHMIDIPKPIFDYTFI